MKPPKLRAQGPEQPGTSLGCSSKTLLSRSRRSWQTDWLRQTVDGQHPAPDWAYCIRRVSGILRINLDTGRGNCLLLACKIVYNMF